MAVQLYALRLFVLFHPCLITISRYLHSEPLNASWHHRCLTYGESPFCPSFCPSFLSSFYGLIPSHWFRWLELEREALDICGERWTTQQWRLVDVWPESITSGQLIKEMYIINPPKLYYPRTPSPLYFHSSLIIDYRPRRVDNKIAANKINAEMVVKAEAARPPLHDRTGQTHHKTVF